MFEYITNGFAFSRLYDNFMTNLFSLKCLFEIVIQFLKKLAPRTLAGIGLLKVSEPTRNLVPRLRGDDVFVSVNLIYKELVRKREMSHERSIPIRYHYYMLRRKHQPDFSNAAS